MAVYVFGETGDSSVLGRRAVGAGVCVWADGRVQLDEAGPPGGPPGSGRAPGARHRLPAPLHVRRLGHAPAAQGKYRVRV